MVTAQLQLQPTKNCLKSSQKGSETGKTFTKHFKLDLAKGTAVCEKLCRYCSGKLTCANAPILGSKSMSTKAARRAGQPTLVAVTRQNRSEVIDAAFLELIIGASLSLRSADAAAWEKLINVVAPSYRLPSRHTFGVDMLPRHQLLENWFS